MSDHDTAVIEAVPVEIRGPVRLAEREFVDGSGYTLRIEATDGPQRILSEDPLRVRAFVTSNVGAHIGTRQALSAVSGVIPVNVNTPGARIDSTAGATEIRAQSEVWVAVEAAGLVGVWIERRVPRGD